METSGPVSVPTAPESVVDRPVVAAFDVDKTLTHRDCVLPFFLRLTSWRVAPRLLRWAVPVGWALIRRDRDRVKILATRIVMTGLPRRTIEDAGAVLAARITESWLRPDTVGRLEWHRSQGHRIVLVSASFSAYLLHVARHLECDDVLSCEVVFDGSDRCTGQLVDGNCRGVEKQRRLLRWMERSGVGSAPLYAYGDSSGDSHLLAMAAWPTLVTKRPIDRVPQHLVDDEKKSPST